jgi:hypothetical protein
MCITNINNGPTRHPRRAEEVALTTPVLAGSELSGGMGGTIRFLAMRRTQRSRKWWRRRTLATTARGVTRPRWCGSLEAGKKRLNGPYPRQNRLHGWLLRLEQWEVERWARVGERRWTIGGVFRWWSGGGGGVGVLPLSFFKRRRGVGNGRRREELGWPAG